MIRLNRPQLTSLRPLFDTSILRLVGESMLAANTKGTAWVDSLSAPKLALIHEGSCVFVSGDSDRHDSVAVLAGLLGAEAGERGFLKLLCTPDDGRWDGVEILPTRFEDGIQRRIYPRIESDDRAVVDTLPPEIELKQIGVIVRSCGSGGREIQASTAERKRAYPQGDHKHTHTP